jgi:hypothetical protein
VSFFLCCGVNVGVPKIHMLAPVLNVSIKRWDFWRID